MKALFKLLLFVAPLLVLFGSCENAKPVFKNGLVQVQPTTSQSITYAFKTGYTGQLVLGIAMIAAVIFLVIRKAQDRGVGEKHKDSGIVFYLVLFALLGGALGFIIIKPANIQGDNVKALTEAQYQYYLQKDDDLRSVWDSCYQNNLLISAPKK